MNKSEARREARNIAALLLWDAKTHTGLLENDSPEVQQAFLELIWMIRYPQWSVRAMPDGWNGRDRIIGIEAEGGENG